MSKTLENLAKAFIGESQARNRYTFYAKTAFKENLFEISDIFIKTADNEAQHAKELLKMIKKIQGDQIEIKVEVEVPNVFGTTTENLKSAIAGEHHENSEMYPEFGNTAQEEGLLDEADKLRAIGFAEKHHEEVFAKLLNDLENGKIFKKDEEVNWECQKCGYLHTGKEAPEKCRSCGHPTEYFRVYC
ncbi:MAG: rubrerythrin family protein [Patescibacteria group bacterium]